MRKIVIPICCLYFLSFCGVQETDKYVPDDLYECSTLETNCSSDENGQTCETYYYFGCFKGTYKCVIYINTDTIKTTTIVDIYPEYTSDIRPISFTSEKYEIEFYPEVSNDFFRTNTGKIRYNNIDYQLSNCTGYLLGDSIFMKIRAVSAGSDTIFAKINSIKE